MTYRRLITESNSQIQGYLVQCDQLIGKHALILETCAIAAYNSEQSLDLAPVIRVPLITLMLDGLLFLFCKSKN